MIELLVVIAIVAVLSGLLMPALGMVRSSARATKCSSNYRQVYIAYGLYAEENEGSLPRATYVGGVLQSFGQADVAAGQAGYLNENPCRQWGSHNPVMMACPEMESTLIRWIAEPYRCYNYPSYWPNTQAWQGWSQFSRPQTHINPVAISPSLLPLLVESSPGYWGGLHWAGGPVDRFSFAHKSRMNMVYFDGHVASIVPAKLSVLLDGDD